MNGVAYSSCLWYAGQTWYGMDGHLGIWRNQFTSLLYWIVESITVTPCDYLYIPQDISSDEYNHWIDQVNRRKLFPTSQPRLSIIYWSSSSTITKPTQLTDFTTCASPQSANTSSERYPLELSYYERDKYDRWIRCEWGSSQWIRCRSGREEET